MAILKLYSGTQAKLDAKAIESGALYVTTDTKAIAVDVGSERLVLNSWANISDKPTSFTPSAHTHPYAGSSTAGGAATSANKLNTDAGGADEPVYFANGIPITTGKKFSSYLPLAGGTLTGKLTLQSNKYADNRTDGALDLQNSNILGINSIYTADVADNAQEGIHFYRDGTHVDTIWASSGKLYFTPNRALGSNGTSYEVLTTNYTGALSHTHTDTNVSWDLTNAHAGYVSAIENATSHKHSANRIAYADPSGVTVEYSTDGGSSWISLGDDSSKIALVTTGTAFKLGNKNSGATTDDMLRITLDAQTMGVYTACQRLLINSSSDCGLSVSLEAANNGTKTTFTDQGTFLISGYSGWSSIPLAKGIFGGNSSQTSQNGVYRLTFSLATNSSGNTSSFGQVLELYMIGRTFWSSPSNMAATGHLYRFDTGQNASFPASVAATAFSGSGASLTALNASNISSGTLNAGRLPTSGVVAASYGPSTNAAPAHSGTFSVPYITVDSYGRVTSASTKTITLPADNDTTYSNFVKSGAGAKAGLVPAPSTTAGTTKYLCEDGTWSVPPDNNTTYSANNGVGLSGTTFYNSGVRSIATGSTNGTISVNTNGTSADVAVKGLGSAAYTESAAYAAAEHSHSAADITSGILSVAKGGTGQTTLVNGANSFLAALPDFTATPTDTTKLVRRDKNDTATFGQITFSTVWTYIKNKIVSTFGIGDTVTIVKSLQPSTDWTDTGIVMTDIVASDSDTTNCSTVAIQIYNNTNSANGNGYAICGSGVMTVYSGGTNATTADEIPLHQVSHADNNVHMYLRVIRVASSGIAKLQISQSKAATAASDYTFKFRKLI